MEVKMSIIQLHIFAFSSQIQLMYPTYALISFVLNLCDLSFCGIYRHFCIECAVLLAIITFLYTIVRSSHGCVRVLNHNLTMFLLN